MSISGYPCFRKVSEIYAAMQLLATTYPTLATWNDIGDSWVKGNPGADDPSFPNHAGSDIKVIKVTNSASPIHHVGGAFTKPVILITGGMHARELAGPESAARFADYLLTNYNVLADVTWLVDYCEIHIIPLVNPDGHNWSEQDAHYLWRKNANFTHCPGAGGGSAYYGVDLNRNFNFHWAAPVDPCDLVYPGPSAASEPETAAIQNYMSSIFTGTYPPSVTSTGLYIDLHSYAYPPPNAGYVLWPWGYSAALAPTNTQLEKLARKLNYWFGADITTVAEQLYLLYGTSQFGTGVDYAYGNFGVGSISFEIGTAFFQDCAGYTGIYYPKVRDALIYAVKAARRPYQSPFGPDSRDLKLSEYLVQAGTSVNLTGYADNTRLKPTPTGTSHPTVSRYTIDDPSWITGTPTYDITVVDSSGMGLIFKLSASIDTSGWSVGTHTVLVETQDLAGNWGAPSAIFLTIAPLPTSYTPTIERCNIGAKNGTLKGYAFGCSDANGKIYFAPCYTTQGPAPQYVHGYGVRFDPATLSSGFLAAPGQTGSGWEVCNFADPATGHAEALGFHGAAYANGFVYYAPLWGSNPAGVFNGTVTRFDTTKTFIPANSQVFDITTLGGTFANAKGFVGVVTDIRYLYFVPYSNVPSSSYHGLVVRFDTQGAGTLSEFQNPTRWSIFDLTTKSASAKGYHLGCYDGSKWVYFSPNSNAPIGSHGAGSHGIVARYDTTAAGGFTNAASWEIFDVTTLTGVEWGAAKQFYGCVKAGKWIYFVGDNPDILVSSANYLAVVRYDSTKALNDPSAWQIVNGLSVIPGAGFAGCNSDGTYVYFATDFSLIGGIYRGSGKSVIHDSRTSDLTTGWETIDLLLSQPNQCHHGNVLSGGYVYDIPLKQYVNNPYYNAPNAQASRYVAKSTIPTPVSHTVTTSVVGLQITIDGTTYTSPQTVSWIPGVSHTLVAPTPQLFSGNYKYFDHWDSGASDPLNPTRSVTAPSSAGTIYTAYYVDINPHPVPAPSIPLGTISGRNGVSYTYRSSIMSVCDVSHIEMVRFDWGDGSPYSDFIDPTYSLSHSWPNAGTYYVKAQAECETTPGKKQSLWSSSLKVDITVSAHVVPTPSVSGDDGGEVGLAYWATAAYTLCQTGHVVSFKFDWGDGIIGSWGYGVEQYHFYSPAGNYSIKVKVRCESVYPNVESSWSDLKSVNISGHKVSTPSIPVGPTTGNIGVSYNYISTVPLCAAGHYMQIMFDWGDGAFSDWTVVTNVAIGANANHIWNANGTYLVKALAKCLTSGTDGTIWSDSLTVVIGPAADTVSNPGAPATASTIFVTGGQYSFLVTWAHATHPSEIQIAFDWGDGTIIEYKDAASSPYTDSHTWASINTYQVKAKAKCKTSGAESGWSDTLSVTVTGDNTAHVQIPVILGVGRSIDIPETYWTYLCSWVVCQEGHTLQIQFDYDDGHKSSWVVASTMSKAFSRLNHVFSGNGPFYVKVKAKCLETGIESGWSEPVKVDKTDPNRVIGNTRATTGNNSGVTGTLYTFDASGIFHDKVDPTRVLQYRFYWGDGVISGWGAASQPHSWSKSGTYWIRAQAKCLETGITSGWAYPKTIKVAAATYIHTVLPPGIPIGPITGHISTSYVYSDTYTLCQVGHTMEIQFDWGDGTLSPWGSVTASQSHSWTSGGIYQVAAQVKCTDTGEVSEWSDYLTVTIDLGEPGIDTIAAPSTPTGPTSGVVGAVYSYSSTEIHAHATELMFDWGDSTFSSWSTSSSQQSHHWSANGTYLVRAQARCTVSGLLSVWSSALTVVIGSAHVVPTPGTPSGPVAGITGTPYTYATVVTHCSVPGHAIQIRFDWGDGSYSVFQTASGSPFSVSHTWNTQGIFIVKAQAKCLDTGITSDWSGGFSVTITVAPGGHTIDAPGYLEGASFGYTNISYSYNTTYWAPCSNLAHTWYVRVDWGDGVIGAWQNMLIYTIPLLWHSWSLSGSYSIKAQVKCMSGGVDTAISNWGAPVTVDITSGSETVATPSIPTGAATVMVGSQNLYSVTGSYSTLGHPIEYQFDWGDGSLSGWNSGSNISYTWQSGGTFQVKARARCVTDTSVISYWSNALYVNVIAGESVSTPTILSGPASGGINTSYMYTTGGSSSSLGHSIQYQFTWGDGSTSGWLAVGVLTASHAWTTAGNYTISVMARCYSHGIQSATKSMAVSIAGEIVSTPNTPVGNQIIGLNITYTYTVGGSISSAGHALEYEVDWGDGTALSWSASLSLTHIWIVEGMFWVRVRARCATHTSIVSNWSIALGVLVSSNIEFLWEVEETVTADGFCFVTKAEGDSVYFAGIVGSTSSGYELIPISPVTPGLWRVEKRVATTGVLDLNYEEPSSIISSGCKDIEIYGNDLYLAGFEHETLPLGAYCIGWYKINEGSGVVLNNSAPVGVANRLPNLDVYNAGTFWTAYSGFGTGAFNQYAYKNDTARIIYNDQTKACFFRFTGAPFWSLTCYLYASSALYQGSSWQHIEIDPGDVQVVMNMGNNWGVIISTGGTPYQILPGDIQNTWMFMFSYLAADGKYKLGIVSPGGTLTIGRTVATVYSSSPSESQSHFFAFRSWNGSLWRQFEGQIGDIIVYNSVILSLSEIAIWYDSLRSRYGMAARSGW